MSHLMAEFDIDIDMTIKHHKYTTCAFCRSCYVQSVPGVLFLEWCPQGFDLSLMRLPFAVWIVLANSFFFLSITVYSTIEVPTTSCDASQSEGSSGGESYSAVIDTQEEAHRKDPANILETINIEYGEPQVVINLATNETIENLQQTQQYITSHSSWKRTCQNQHQLCSYWAATGECQQNPAYMKVNCAPSCQQCEVPEEDPVQLQRIQMINASLAADEKGIMVQTAFGEAQFVPVTNSDPVVQNIANSSSYMLGLYGDDNYARVRNHCQNKHSMCSLWASQSECMKNPTYMSVMCAPSCSTCEQISYEYRCPFDRNATTALHAGDLDKLFRRIVSTYPQRDLSILSSPPTGPWVLQLENFASITECERLIQSGHELGYNTSVMAGKESSIGSVEPVASSSVRTSTNAWCEGVCEKDALISSLLERIEHLVEIPQKNSEFLQLLRYEPDQFYRQHHDYLEHHLNRPQGVRVLTMFLYLNDVEDGGETRFTNLDINIKPKQGRAVLWPSVENQDPNKKDPRTEHEALSVRQGIKYGANAWIHQRDFKEPYQTGCA